MGQIRIGRWVALVVVAPALMLGVFALSEGTASHMKAAVRDSLSPWEIHIQKVDEALAERNADAAVRAWHDAYIAALGSWRWEGMVAVGDAYLRIGEGPVSRHASQAKARQIYLAALFRAHQQVSLDGVLRAAEAFADLGDREVVEQSIRIAERLAEQDGDPQAGNRVRTFAERWAARVVEAQRFHAF